MRQLFRNIFSCKTQPFSELAGWLRTDMHSHLLPGVDDGATDAAMAEELATGLKSLGYEKLITTPHQLAPMYLPTEPALAAAFGQLPAGLVHRYAREYMADDLLLEQVEERPQELRCVKDNGLLIEFSYAVKPYRSAEILFALSKAGFTPILAHPERYSYFSTSQDDYEELLGYGCRFQLNALSLGGYYGKGALERARYLLQLGQVHFIGTDLHQPRHLQALQNLHLSEELMKLVMQNPIENQRL